MVRDRVPTRTTGRKPSACRLGGADEFYSKYLRHLNAARNKVDRATPQGLTAEQRMDGLTLFIALSGLQADDCPRR